MVVAAVEEDALEKLEVEELPPWFWRDTVMDEA